MLEAALNTVSIGYEGANKYKVRVAHKPIVAARHMTDGLARGLALSSKPPLRAFTATRRHPLAPTGSRGPPPAPG